MLLASVAPQAVQERPAISLPKLLLHLEGAAFFAASIVAYTRLGGNGWVFALLLFAPDLSALGYLVNTRVGALAYNLAHTYVTPILLAGIGFWLNMPALVEIALILSAHISMDRTVGYGLKYPSAFKDTHLGRV